MWILWVVPSVLEAQEAELGTEDLEREAEFRSNELERIRAELERNRADVQQLRGRERKVGEQIEAVEKEIALTERYLRALRREEQDLKSRIHRADSSLDATQDRLSRRERAFADRLREMYKRGRPGGLEMAMSSRSFPDLLKRHRYMTLVAHQDRQEYERIRTEKAETERDKRILEAGYREKVRIEREKERERQHLTASKTKKDKLLIAIWEDRHLREERIEEQQRSLAKLESLIEELMEKIVRRKEHREILGTEFAARKGSLSWPLEGRVLTRFGRYRDKVLRTVTFNRGIDIEAPEGSEVRGVADGTIVLTEWMRGYGKVLLIHHGGEYFTLYAHLSEILVGQGDRIRKGDVIAISGETGSLDGPKLHFEVLEGKEAQDPLGWLERVGNE